MNLLKNQSIEDEKKEEIIDINEAKNNMTRVNNNANISNFTKDIFFNRLTKRNFNELRKRTTLSYLNQETQPTLLITETKQLDTDYSFKKNSISNINESSSMNKFNIIEKKENDQSKERKRNIKEVPIFPILKGSKNISNSLQNYRYKRMTPSILRNDAFKTKVSNFDLTKHFFNSYTPVRPSFDKEKKLNYLTIKQFYNGFNGQVTKYNMIKK